MPIDISVRSAKAVGAAAPAADPSLPCTSGVVSPLLWNFTGFGKENLVPKLGSFLLHPVLGKMPTCIAATVPPAPTEAAVPLGAPLADGVQGAGEFLVLKIGAAADRLRARSTESGGGRAPESPRGWRPFRDHHVYGARAMQGHRPRRALRQGAGLGVGPPIPFPLEAAPMQGSITYLPAPSDGSPAQALLPLVGEHLLLPGSALQVRLTLGRDARQSSRRPSPTRCRISGHPAPRSPGRRTTARCS